MKNSIVFAGMIVGLLMCCRIAPLYGDSEVRYRIEPNSGEWSMEGPKLSLRGTLASVQVGGKWIRMDGPVTVGRAVAVTDVLGTGERRVVTAPAKDGVELSLSVTVYRTGNRALMEASMRNVSDKTLRVTSFRAFEANVTTLAPARECRARSTCTTAIGCRESSTR